MESGYAGGRSEGEELDRKLVRGFLLRGFVRDDGLEFQMFRFGFLSFLQCLGFRFYFRLACVGFWFFLIILIFVGGKVCKLIRSLCFQISDFWEKFFICGFVFFRFRVYVKRYKIESFIGLFEFSRFFIRFFRTGFERVLS